jgi:hypothetical protein
MGELGEEEEILAQVKKQAKSNYTPVETQPSCCSGAASFF